MKRIANELVVLSVILLAATGTATTPQSIEVTRNLTSMPLAFTENQGQWDEQVLFRANAGGATMWFTSDGAVYQFTRHIPVGQSAAADRGPDARQEDRPPDLQERFDNPVIPAQAGIHSYSGRQTPSSAPNASRPHNLTLSGLEGRHHQPDSVESIAIKASFIGANPNPQMVGLGEMEYKCNYFIGNDPNEWHTDVPNYSAIVYEDIYTGIDLKYYG
ncbi:MAG: hypothetical protein KAW61_07775, partial [candidate division Zixibacteria bacterium]|nr:hypothetical protein [candidate division Zixibacteria bacterium]